MRQSALPLRIRLSLITAALLLVALAGSSFAGLALLQRSLVSQVDAQLATAARPLTQAALEQLPQGRGSELLPSDYYVRILTTDGQVHQNLTGADDDDDAIPAIPDLTVAEVSDIAGDVRTVGSQGPGPSWRLAIYTITDPGGHVLGSVAVALPLTAVDATMRQMRTIFTLVGAAVVAIAGVLGYFAVKRSLRGLRDIESTAAAVAAGDLSQRAPDAPTSTEVGRLGSSFNAMVANLEEAFAARAASEERMRRFVSDASHELRTPLASIRGYGELYRMGAVPQADVGTTMARIESESIRMGSLVNDLLALARLDEGRELRVVPVDLTAIASDAVGDVRALDPSRPAQLLADAPVLVDGDADRLRQVVTNLIGNAVQHTPTGTPVEVAVHAAADGAAVLEVRDHGPGIAPANAERVFERFYRPDSSRARISGGSGLGLAIVATIVAAHGGTVRHEPTPGGGATMVVRLPLRVSA